MKTTTCFCSASEDMLEVECRMQRVRVAAAAAAVHCSSVEYKSAAANALWLLSAVARILKHLA